MEWWKEHFKELLEGNLQLSQDTGQILEKSDGREEDGMSLDTGWDGKALRKLKNRKATGHDGISQEMVNSMDTLSEEFWIR